MKTLDPINKDNSVDIMTFYGSKSRGKNAAFSEASLNKSVKSSNDRLGSQESKGINANDPYGLWANSVSQFKRR